MEDNKIYCKPAYKCGVCGKEHNDIASRAACEIACLKKQEEEAKKAAEVKKQAEKETRKKEVELAIKEAKSAERKANKLMQDFMDDYGSYEFELDDSDDNGFWPAKLLHHIWF